MIRLIPVLSLLACGPDSGDGLLPGPDDTAPGTDVPVGSVSPERTTPLAIDVPFDPRASWSSSTVAQDGAGQTVYTVDRDNRRLVAFTTATRTTRTVDLDGAPSHVARFGDTLLVSLRDARSIVQIDASTLEVLQTVELGAEPMGIVTRPDGDRVYVALSQDEQVVELGSELQVLARITVPSEPRYLALHPDGMRLFIGSGRGVALLSTLNLDTLQRSMVPIPTTLRQTLSGNVVDMIPRITGDLAMTVVDGRARLAVPTLYSDTTTPIPDIADPSDIEESDTPNDPFFPGEEGGYGGGGGTDVDRLNPAIVTYDVEGQAYADAAPILVVSPTEDGFANDTFTFRSVRSYVNGLAWAPGGRLVASLEAEGATVMLDPSGSVFAESFFSPPEASGFRMVPVAAVRSGAGTMGAVYTSASQAWSVSAFELQLAELPVADANARLADLGSMGFLQAEEPLQPLSTVTFGESPLSAQLQLGRRLFFSADNPSMGAGGVSCSTCHYEGRNDGITWTFEGGVRQTPSLAGIVSDTAPVTWTSNVASVAMEADITTRGRMGGEGLNAAELAAVEAFVDSTPLPDVPTVRDTAAVTRGQQLFAAQGCAACHSGDALTDNGMHALRGMSLNTPKLLGVAGSAPYLVDGSAATLRDVLELASEPGNMGSTAGLSPADLDDLEAYLRTL